MSDQQGDAKKETARATLRAFIREEIKGKAEVKLPDVTNRVVRTLIKDKALLKAVLVELLRPLVYEEARILVSKSRNAGDNLIQLGDEIVSRGKLKERAARMSRNWLEFMEHAGPRHILVMDMTADDLSLAEAERRQRGDAEYGYANLWAKLRTRIEAGQVVRDVWGAEEIEALYRSVKAA